MSCSYSKHDVAFIHPTHLRPSVLRLTSASSFVCILPVQRNAPVSASPVRTGKGLFEGMLGNRIMGMLNFPQVQKKKKTSIAVYTMAVGRSASSSQSQSSRKQQAYEKEEEDEDNYDDEDQVQGQDYSEEEKEHQPQTKTKPSKVKAEFPDFTEDERTTEDFGWSGDEDNKNASQKAASKRLSSDEAAKKSASKRALTNFDFMPATLQALQRKGFDQLTPIQADVYKPLLEGRNIIAKSRTGTGKTLAFGIPIVEKLARTKLALEKKGKPLGPGRGPFSLVLCPTRELAKQVQEELIDIARPHRLSVYCFYGGVSYNPQEDALRRGIDILVGTPGRIMDHMEKGALNLRDVRFAVLDEADEMLSMGFADKVEDIFSKMVPRDKRQTVMLSATMPSWVKTIALRHMERPAMYDAVGQGENKTPHIVRHVAFEVSPNYRERQQSLAEVVSAYHKVDPRSRVLVFTQTRREADILSRTPGIGRTGVLHGKISQASRERTLDSFKQGRITTLVATNVAARGLDISGVDLVLQFNIPEDTEKYIHRAGRTGRAGRPGTAMVFYSKNEFYDLRKVESSCMIKFELIHESHQVAQFVPQ